MDKTFGEPKRICGKAHCPGRGQLFHAGGQIGGLADGGILHVQIVTYRGDDNFAGIQADPELDFYTVRATHLVAISTIRGLHCERCVTSTNGMILVREWRTENCHYAVTHHVVYGTLNDALRP